MVLKPLDLALAYVMYCEFEHEPDQAQAQRTAEFRGGVLRLVAEEYLELRPRPSTYHELKARLDRIYNIPITERNRWICYDPPRTGVVNPLVRFAEAFVDKGVSAIRQTGFETFLRLLVQVDPDFDETDSDNMMMNPNYPLGHYLRETWLQIDLLSFEQAQVFNAELATWCGYPTQPSPPNRQIRPPPGRDVDRTAPLEQTDTTLTRLGLEYSLDKKLQAWEEYCKASASGDASLAQDALRRFFTYEKSRPKRSVNPHALLNTANQLYATGGLEAARAMVMEAIRIARMEKAPAANCLTKCMSLLRRLDREMLPYCAEPRSGPVPDSELPPARTGELHDVSAAIDRGEKLTLALHRLQTMERHAHANDPARTEEHYYAEQPDQGPDTNAIYSTMWDMLGSKVLADVYADLTLENPDASNDTRLAVMIGRAQRVARSGQPNTALRMLAHRDTWTGLNLQQYERWSCALWDLVESRCKNSLDWNGIRLIRSQRGLRLDQISPTTPVPQQILQSLDQVQEMLANDTPPHLIKPIAERAFEVASSTDFVSAERRARVLLSEVLLRIPDIAPNSLSLVDHLEPSSDTVLGGDDQEVIARYALVMAHADATRWHRNRSQGQRLSSSLRYLRLAQVSGANMGLKDVVERAKELEDALRTLSGLSSGMASPSRTTALPDAGYGLAPADIRYFADLIRSVGVLVAGGGGA